MHVPVAVNKDLAHDSLLQLTNMSLKTHAAAMNSMKKSAFLRKERAPDDEDYDFADDDDDDPADFSVGQFLDEDDDSFIQLGSKKDEEDDLGDDRLGSEYILASDRDAQMKQADADDEEESDPEAEDALHEVLLQEARKHHKRAHAAETTMTESKKQNQSHKHKRHPAMLGVTDVYSQLALEEANGNGAENGKGWFGGEDSDDGEDDSFIQTEAKNKDANDDDDEDGLADDRLDGGMDQILAATAESQ